MSILTTVYRWHKWRNSLKLFKAIKASEKDHLIDCGANIGDFTAILAAKGGYVHAIEPNPIAFRALSKRFDGFKKVSCIEAAAHTQSGEASLYLHKNSTNDPLKFSTGSSMLKEKGNIDVNSTILVKTINLGEFIKNLGHVRILKIDIEGAEVELLECLISLELTRLVDYIFVETHDHKIPELKERTERIRNLCKTQKFSNIHLDWQ